MGETIESYSGFLEGIDVRTDDFNQQITVFVFKSKNSAIGFMEKRDSFFTAYINEGDNHYLFNGKWWYIKWVNVYGIFLNQWNTIVEVNYTFKPNENVEVIVINTALEISSKIDSLSK